MFLCVPSPGSGGGVGGGTEASARVLHAFGWRSERPDPRATGWAFCSSDWPWLRAGDQLTAPQSCHWFSTVLFSLSNSFSFSLFLSLCFFLHFFFFPPEGDAHLGWHTPSRCEHSTVRCEQGEPIFALSRKEINLLYVTKLIGRPTIVLETEPPLLLSTWTVLVFRKS